MSQIQTIRAASNLDDTGLAALAEAFAAISAEIFSRARLTVAVTTEESARTSMHAPLTDLLATLPDGAAIDNDRHPTFARRASSTAWQYNLPVAYVSRVFRTVPYTHPDAPALIVLAKLLRADFLHREIREKGGAYGGMAGYSADGGLFSMLSYRDPHLERTLDVYHQAVEWTCRGDFSSEMIKQSILTAFAELDRPLSPGSRGYREFLHQQQGMTHDMIQAFRNGILAVNRKQLARVAQSYLEQTFEDSSVGILAGEEMFGKAERTLSRLQAQIKRLE